jgi:hypothetical protein
VVPSIINDYDKHDSLEGYPVIDADAEKPFSNGLKVIVGDSEAIKLPKTSHKLIRR